MLILNQQHRPIDREGVMDTMNKTKHSPLPWKIYGATVIWSPEGHANVAAVSDPHPPNDSSVGYYEIRPWTDNDAGKRFEEACANAELIVTAVNERERLREAMLDAIDKLERTTSVQDRPVTLIKQSCRFIAKNLRAALNDQKGE